MWLSNWIERFIRSCDHFLKLCLSQVTSVSISSAPIPDVPLYFLNHLLWLLNISSVSVLFFCFWGAECESERVSHSVVSNTLWPHPLQPTRLLCLWNSPVKNTGVSCHFLLQGIFPTQGLNWGLPLYRQTPYQLSHQGSPRILEWVVSPFSRGSSQPRDWTGVSYIAGGICISWGTREGRRYQTLYEKWPLWIELCSHKMSIWKS